MALRKLLLRNKLDVKTKALKDLRDKDADFEKREKELEDAINEMNEETSDEDREAVEQQATEFQEEKEQHENSKKELEQEIAGIEEELKAEDPMRWVGEMNNIFSLAEEIVMEEVIYS